MKSIARLVSGVEGARAFRTIAQIDRILRTRTIRNEPLRHEFNGPLLERWFLKTTVNLFSIGGGDKTWIAGSPSTDPPDTIVRAAFGETTLTPPMGLYSTSDLGDRIQRADQVGFTPKFLGTALASVAFAFQVLRFELWLVDRPPDGGFGTANYRHHGAEFRGASASAQFHVVW